MPKLTADGVPAAWLTVPQQSPERETCLPALTMPSRRSRRSRPPRPTAHRARWIDRQVRWRARERKERSAGTKMHAHNRHLVARVDHEVAGARAGDHAARHAATTVIIVRVIQVNEVLVKIDDQLRPCNPAASVPWGERAHSPATARADRQNPPTAAAVCD